MPSPFRRLVLANQLPDHMERLIVDLKATQAAAGHVSDWSRRRGPIRTVPQARSLK